MGITLVYRYRSLVLEAVAALVLAAAPLCGTELARWNWEEEFDKRTDNQGNLQTVSAAFASRSHLYVYDRASGRIVEFDSDLAITGSIALESVGRGTYVGDDFVVRDSQFVFLNTVDRKLEIFDRTTGKHIRAPDYPYEYFADEPRRSHRIIDRIFLDGDRIMVGNRHAVFAVAISLHKAARAGTAARAPKGWRFVLYSDRRNLLRDQDGRLRTEKGLYVPLQERVPLSGKRYFFMNGKLCGLRVDSGGIAVVEVE